MNGQIVCPHCKKPIPLTQALSSQIQEKYRQVYRQRLEEEKLKLENVISGRKSKTRVFFKFVSTTDWQFLSDYKEYINWYDKNLRTPEFHKSSILRKHFLKGSEIKPKKVSGIVNIIMNAIWENGLEIIQGIKPSRRYWHIAQKF